MEIPRLNWKRWIAGACLCLLAFLLMPSCPVRHPPGVIAPDEPRQGPLDDSTHPHYVEFAKIVPLATFDITARVLSRSNYYFDDASDVVPMDLVLGWGRMSDSAILKEIDITHSFRFYWWRYSGLSPIPEAEIIRCSANMHLAPANDWVKKRMKKVRKGDIVHISGYLVSIQYNDGAKGWTMHSSLTRTDDGPGACEVVWVEDFSIETN